MNLPGFQKFSLSRHRRLDQAGIISKGFSVRWTAALLMVGGVGAAWAFNPMSAVSDAPLTPKAASSRIVVEGDPQVVAPLLGSLMGEVAFSAKDRELLSKSVGSRIVLRSAPSADPAHQDLRNKGKFLRAVEEVEEQYLSSGVYPALPPSGAAGLMNYRTDGQDFSLSLGHRSYNAQNGMSFGAAPTTAGVFEVVGFLQSEETGWGPWREPSANFAPKEGLKDVDDLDFLTEDVVTSSQSARLFFPIDRETCGYLFRKDDGESIYSSGELVYDAALGSFSLKLYRTGQVSGSPLNADRLDKESAARDGAVVLVGDQTFLSDLGLASVSKDPKNPDGVVVVSSAAALSCSVSTALDGLRFAALSKHQEQLPIGTFLAGPETSTRSTVSGRVQLQDKMGQLHQLRLRAGRASDYDWVIGQVCPAEEQPRAESFVESGYVGLEEPPVTNPIVKAGQ